MYSKHQSMNSAPSTPSSWRRRSWPAVTWRTSAIPSRSPASNGWALRQPAILAGAVAAFDTAQSYAASGARTTASWLKHECRLPGPEASRQLRRGRLCRHVPLFEEAWSKGQISSGCLDVVAAVRRPATEEALARDEAMLVEYAKTLTHDQFVRVMRYWEQHADPDGAEDDAMDARNHAGTPTWSRAWVGPIWAR